MISLDQQLWTQNPSHAVRIQNELRHKVLLRPLRKKIRLVAGADVSFNKYSPIFYAAFVVLDFNDMSIVEKVWARVEVNFPYIPGLLSFREIPALMEAYNKLESRPDVFLFDGHGIAHPRRMGIAAHMGLIIDQPSIGCAKKILAGQFEIPGSKAGDCTPVLIGGEQVGYALRTKKNTKPVFVSPGHKADFDTALNLVLSCCRGYRIPEPTRQAHIFVNEIRRSDYWAL